MSQMTEVTDWSLLPVDLLDSVSNRLFSKVELVRFRSICKPWRSAVSRKKRFPHHHNRNRNRKRILSSLGGRTCSLSPAAFLRVALSSYPNEGWLVKTQDVPESHKKQLVSPLSRFTIKSSDPTIDLLEYTVSEIHQSYDIHYSQHNHRIWYDFPRVVLVGDLVFGVDYNKMIRCYKSEEEGGNNVWTRIKDEVVEYFSDIIVQKSQVYALDLTGAIWWISLSELEIFQFGPPPPVEYYDLVEHCKDMRLIEYCGDLCIVQRYCKDFRVDRVEIEKTIGFRVYKMDEELVEWVEVSSLGDKAFVMATDSFFCVLASEYYGCVANSIYFTDEEGEDNVKVFKLADGSITKRVESTYESYFQMLSPPFV